MSKLNFVSSVILGVSMFALAGCTADATEESAESVDQKTSVESVGKQSSAVTYGSCTLNLGGGGTETWSALSREECEWSCIWRNMIGESCVGFSYH